jgi:hypothetical protein
MPRRRDRSPPRESVAGPSNIFPHIVNIVPEKRREEEMAPFIERDGSLSMACSDADKGIIDIIIERYEILTKIVCKKRNSWKGL